MPAAALILLAVTLASAQGRGGGGGFSGMSAPRPRLAVLTDVFTLTDDQRKQIKSILDTEHKKAEPLRKAIVGARDAVGEAIEADRSSAEVEPAVQAYAVQAAAIAHAEMRALAQVMKVLTDAQRANQQGVELAFHYMRGALFEKKWDVAPGGRAY
jgi:Spy/CpxP family protein refolding chaperone